MRKVLLEGSLAYDQILRHKGVFQNNLNEKFISSSYFCDEYNFYFGGTAGNIAYGLYVLGGVEVDLFSVLGGIDAKSYTDRIAGWNFDSKSIFVIEGFKSATACICTDDSEQQLTFFFPGPPTDQFLNLYPKSDSKYDLACVSANAVSLMENSIDFCILNEIPYIFDPGQQVAEIVKSSKINEYLEKSYILVLNRSEFDFLTEARSLTKSDLTKKCKNVIITNGENEIEIYENFGTSISVCGVNKIKAVDPTGAGDSFRAALIKALLDNKNLNESVEFAAEFAIKCIKNYGPQDYL